MNYPAASGGELNPLWGIKKDWLERKKGFADLILMRTF
jgi:hypothetical protein